MSHAHSTNASANQAPPAGYEEAFREVTQASHVPGRFYHDPAILAREEEVIFKREWLCLAREEEFANPGDYKTYRIASQPVLLCRDEAGKMRAYANMCLHRGVEIASGSGNTQEFTCPYHGWLYNLDGQLLGASYMRDAENFEAKKCRLPELALGVWCGWVFVSLARQPMPFETYMKDFDEKFGFLQMQDLRMGLRMDVELDCNWKLMVENFIDFYHIGVLHKDTIGRFMRTTDVPYELRERGQVYINEYDTGSLTKTGQSNGMRIPALEDKGPRFSATGVLPPNINFFVRPDYVTMYTSWPLGPSRMRLTGVTLWRQETLAQPDADRIVAEFKTMVEKVVAEDVDMVESLQNVMKAEYFVPGRMSRLEKGVQHYIKHMVQTVMGEAAA